MSNKIRVIVVDDQALVLDGIVSLLALADGINVCGTASGGRDGVVLAMNLAPDVVLMDIRMPGMTGIEAVTELGERGFAGAVIMLTTFDDREYIYKSLRAGAAGYLLKDLPVDELVRAIIQVHNGVFQLAPSVIEGVLDDTPDAQVPDEQQLRLIDLLTGRELEIFRLIGEGCNNKEISEQLFLSEGTVKNYITTIFSSLNLRDRVQAALLSAAWGRRFCSGKDWKDIAAKNK